MSNDASVKKKFILILIPYSENSFPIKANPCSLLSLLERFHGAPLGPEFGSFDASWSWTQAAKLVIWYNLRTAVVETRALNFDNKKT